MTQIVIGAALGYIVAHAVIFGTRHSMLWLRRDGLLLRLRGLSSLPGPAVAAGLVKYGAVVGASAALLALGAWAIGDYYSARSAGNSAAASVADSTAAPAPALSPLKPEEEEVAAQPPPAPALAAATTEAADPYADPAFKVQPVRHDGTGPSLTEKLLRRSEARARSELLAETQQHAQRSQYDCEAADRAARYLKAGLDVWGFATWQEKYFPAASYKGATLSECRDIKSLVEPAGLDLRSTVAQGNHT